MEGTWSSGMILASGARGREFDSPSAPFPTPFVHFPFHIVRKSLEFVFIILCGRISLGTPFGNWNPLGWGASFGNANPI